jgi:hypothetical protein
MTRRRLILIALTLLALIGVSVWVARRGKSKPTLLPKSAQEQTKSAEFVETVGEKVFFPYLSQDGSRILYFGD